MIVDAHIDLAWNMANGRDPRLPAAETRRREAKDTQQCMVGLPDMRAGGVAVFFGSIFVMKGVKEGTDHDVDPELVSRGKQQVGLYQGLEDEDLVRIIRTRASLEDHLALWADDRLPGLLIAMEGAEPIESPDDLQWWFDGGVRMIGPAWGPSRYCGGFAGSHGVAGGLTPIGKDLVAGMKDLSIPLDLAHSSVELFADGVSSDHPHVVCTHTSPREVLKRDRMPDGEMMRALAARGGIIGLGLGNMFLEPSWQIGEPPVPLERVGEVLSIMASGAGWDHVGIGSDLDGGIGLDESPDGLENVGDIGKIGDVVPDEAREGVLGENWLRFLRDALPQSSQLGARCG
jgi:membrane dipeptidase